MALHAGFVDAVQNRMAELGLKRPAAAARVGIPRRTFQSYFKDAQPTLENAEKICVGLGLDFHLGTPRGDVAERPALPPDTEAHRWANRRGQVLTPFPVAMREGHKPERVGFSPNGCASFGLEFLLEFDLNPLACEVIEIFDDSMAPEFPAGAAGLVDLRRTKRADGHVYVMLAPELTVRRAVRADRTWLAAADNRDFMSLPWRDDFLIVGQVVWTSHMVNTTPLKQRSVG